MLKLGGNMGVRARAQGGNIILCVCRTNVDLYIQLSFASKRHRASVDQSSWSRVRTQGECSGFYPRNYQNRAQAPPILGSSSPLHFQTQAFSSLLLGSLLRVQIAQ